MLTYWNSSRGSVCHNDVVGFYEYFYHPDNMYIAVWGDFEPAQMLATLEERFGDWPAGNVEVPPLPNEPPRPRESNGGNPRRLSERRLR